MTREEIIKMAREAGWSGLYITYNEPTGKADWQMVKETLTVPVTMEQIERFAAIVAAAEREACAKVCEAQRNIEWVRANIPLITHDPANTMASKCAAAIRARGQK